MKSVGLNLNNLVQSLKQFFKSPTSSIGALGIETLSELGLYLCGSCYVAYNEIFIEG